MELATLSFRIAVTYIQLVLPSSLTFPSWISLLLDVQTVLYSNPSFLPSFCSLVTSTNNHRFIPSSFPLKSSNPQIHHIPRNLSPPLQASWKTSRTHRKVYLYLYLFNSPFISSTISSSKKHLTLLTFSNPISSISYNLGVGSVIALIGEIGLSVYVWCVSVIGLRFDLIPAR